MVEMSRLERRFWAFHRANPEVYANFDRFAHKMIARGHRHYSADALMHVVRFHTHLETNDPTFKINNSTVAFYAREWMRRNPKHSGFFRTRRQRHQEREAA